MEGTCVVADLGTGSIKAEFAGAEAPRVFANVAGTVKYRALIQDQQIEGLLDGSTFVGNDVDKHRGLCRLTYPMEHGHVTNWTHMPQLFRHVTNALGVPTKDHPIMVTEAPLTSRVQRQRIAQILFEEMQHPALLFSVQAVLSLYSSGNTTGVVLDVGDGVTHACPVVEGYSIREATRRVDFGGRDVTSYLQVLLRQGGHCLDTSADFETVKQIKEKHCYVSRTQRKENDKNSDTAQPVKHKLPDGTEVLLGSELSLAPEVLFQPSLVGKECSGVVQVANEAIRKTDMDVRRALYESIFISGGSTLVNGFCQRFLTETTKLTPRDCKVRLQAPAERLYTAWIGGSFLAQLSSFKQMLTKRSEYLEEGERILHARLFC